MHQYLFTIRGTFLVARTSDGWGFNTVFHSSGNNCTSFPWRIYKIRPDPYCQTVVQCLWMKIGGVKCAMSLSLTMRGDSCATSFHYWSGLAYAYGASRFLIPAVQKGFNLLYFGYDL